MPDTPLINFTEIFNLLQQSWWGIGVIAFVIVSFTANKYLLPITKPIWEAKKAKSEAEKLDFKSLEKQLNDFKLECERDKKQMQSQLDQIMKNHDIYKHEIVYFLGFAEGLSGQLQKLQIDISPQINQLKEKLNAVINTDN